MMPPVFSSENIHRCYLYCRRNKRNTINALRFEYHLEENLLRLQEELRQRTYKPSRSVCFVVKKPKLREIFAADFRDRVVHHILVDALEKVWEPSFIYDSYACRKGKGTHRAVTRLQAFTRKVTCNRTRKAYFIQLDIEGFFFNINKEILYQLIAERVRKEEILWLARAIIFHDCTESVLIKGNKALLEYVPAHKTLFNTENKRGLPIGNLTSQFFANVYLDELDKFVKHRLKGEYYIRYCDDFVLLHRERQRLLGWREKIKEFLKTRLRLNLNAHRQTMGPIRNGMDFLGYIVRPEYLLVRRRVVNHLKQRLSGFESRLIKKDEHPYIKVVFDYTVLERLRATLASYFGHLKWADSYCLQMSLMRRFSFLKRFFSVNDGRVKDKFRVPKNIPSLRLQYRYFRNRFSGDVLLFRVGSHYEFFGDDSDVAGMLGLRKIRGGLSRNVQYGFPVGLERTFVDKIKSCGRSITVITEKDRYLTQVKVRLPKYRLVFEK